MMQAIETIEVSVDRVLSDYEMRRLGKTCDLLGFQRCILNGQELKVAEMCKMDKSWDKVWAEFDKGETK